jgi:hypothetical protein
MLPDSDDLDVYHKDLEKVLTKLNKLKNSQTIPPDLINTLSDLAKDWLRRSEGYRSLGFLSEETLESFDQQMNSILASTSLQTRASSYAKKLQPIASQFLKTIIVPVIKAEGSPSQIIARRLKAIFEPYATLEESAYIDEAARCMILNCHRAAIIMLWAAAIARFHGAIGRLGFNAYNSAVAKTKSKGRYPFNNVSGNTITSLQELQLTREFDIIVVGMELWNYDMQTYEELQRLLGIRNNAAHPGMYEPAPIDVQQFATKLEAYIFKRILP